MVIRFPLDIKITSYLNVKVYFKRLKENESDGLVQENTQNGQCSFKIKVKKKEKKKKQAIKCKVDDGNGR